MRSQIIDMTQKEAVDFLVKYPVRFAKMIGFDKLREDLHNNWIRKMMSGKKDATLQAHRGSFKTTCVSIALALLIVLMPNLRILFIRKNDSDVKEIIAQVKKILQTPQMVYFVRCIYNVNLRLTTDKNGNPMTGAELMAMVAVKEMSKGSARHWELLRDTAGFKPVDKVMIADVDQSVIDQVENMVREANEDAPED